MQAFLWVFWLWVSVSTSKNPSVDCAAPIGVLSWVVAMADEDADADVDEDQV